MAFRPNEYLIKGELDNSVLGKVTGWMEFLGKGKVIFDLQGDFHRDIRGAKISFRGDSNGDKAVADKYMEKQIGKVGDITAGLYPQDYATYPYIEWYSEQNGRVVLEFDKEQMELLTKPIPADKTKPISRKEQHQNMMEFLTGLVKELDQEH